jgi:glycosyltransferase involved in cell wall biosynthesis
MTNGYVRSTLQDGGVRPPDAGGDRAECNALGSTEHRLALNGRTGAAVIRPCMLSFYFHPDYSGSAIQTYNLSRHLQRLGLEPFIVAARLRETPAFEMFDGIPLYRLPVSGRGQLQIASFWASLLKFLLRRRSELDVIHAHGTLQHAAASLLGRLLGKPTLLKVAMAGSDIAFHLQGRTWGRANRFMVSRFDRYIATTSAIADEFQRQGLDSGRVRLIPNGVDTSLNNPVSAAERGMLKRKLGLPDVPIAAYVGILNARKNVDGILRVWRATVARGTPGHLVLIGPLPERSDPAPFHRKLLQFVHDHQLESRVSFLGYRSDVTQYLQASDAFLLPSRQEGMPNSVLEAMACGVPCLVSGTSGIGGLISDGVNGFVAGLDQEETFAAILSKLLVDRSLREAVGERARKTVVASFSLEAVARKYRELYRELLQPDIPMSNVL